MHEEFDDKYPELEKAVEDCAAHFDGMEEKIPK